MGLETEYGVAVDGDASLADAAAQTVIAAGGHDPHHHQPRRQPSRWLADGSRLYLDAGSHPELATGEQTDAADVVAAARRGDAAAHAAGVVAAGRLGVAGIRLLSGTVDAHGNVWGSHENYETPQPPQAWNRDSVLAAYLATRLVWAGAGGLTHDHVGRWRYVVSPRGLAVGDDAGPTSSAARKPLLDLRDERLAGHGHRLHVTVADGNASNEILWLRFAVTDLLLGVCEDRSEVRGRLASILELGSGQAAAIARDVADDPSCAKRWRVGGQLRSAVDVQRILCEHVAEAAPRTGRNVADVEAVCARWQRLLDGLAGDHDRVADTVDWVARYRLLRRITDDGSADALGHPKRRAATILYDAVDGGYGRRLTRSTLPVAAPRAPTRATLRGRVVDAICRAGATADIGWQGASARGMTVRWPDPQVAEDAATDELCDRLDRPRLPRVA
ncbi:MAG: proteasome accessory factor PafA2 family protein [Actinomycetota bacterium]